MNGMTVFSLGFFTVGAVSVGVLFVLVLALDRFGYSLIIIPGAGLGISPRILLVGLGLIEVILLIIRLGFRGWTR